VAKTDVVDANMVLVKDVPVFSTNQAKNVSWFNIISF
jgi:hypothetical protein